MTDSAIPSEIAISKPLRMACAGPAAAASMNSFASTPPETSSFSYCTAPSPISRGFAAHCSTGCGAEASCLRWHRPHCRDSVRSRAGGAQEPRGSRLPSGQAVWRRLCDCRGRGGPASRAADHGGSSRARRRGLGSSPPLQPRSICRFGGLRRRLCPRGAWTTSPRVPSATCRPGWRVFCRAHRSPQRRGTALRLFEGGHERLDP